MRSGRRRVRELERDSIIREARRGLATVAFVSGGGGGGGGSVAALDDIGDVNAPAPADGDVLTWDAVPGEWVATAPSGGGGGTDHIAIPVLTPGTIVDYEIVWDSSGEIVYTVEPYP